MIFCLFGVFLGGSIFSKELMLSWLERYGRRYSKGIWLVVPLSLMKCIWHERNQRFFNGQELSMMKLKFLKSLYE